MPSAAFITPTGSGDRSGSSWDNAATLDQMSAAIATAGPGGTVYVRADQGAYTVGGQAIVVTAGGSADAPVTITGVDGAGNPMQAQIVGDRASPWTAGAASGTEVFKLLAGANNLDFENMAFRNVGNGAFRVGANVANLTIGNMYAENVQRFFENLASSGQSDASVTGLTIHDVTVEGFSRAAIRLQYNSSNVTIRDVIGNSEHQDGDSFATGVVFSGSAHDITVKRVEMYNSRYSLDPNYWNGDGFSSERGNYNITYDSVVASGNTDGGFDLKSQSTTVNGAISIDNAHNYRLWDVNTVLTNVMGGVTNLHGGPATPYNVSVERGASDTIRGGFFYEPNSTNTIFYLGSGNQTLTLQDVFTLGGTYSQTIGGSVIQVLPSTGTVAFARGTAASETMLGSDGQDILYADAGDDRLAGGAGVDQLVGGDGNDYLDGGADADLMAGGTGDDTYVVDNIDDLVAEVEGQGTDLVLAGIAAYQLRANVENLTYTGTIAFRGTGNALDNVIVGGAAGDVLVGFAGNDSLIGGAGADVLVGGTGNDSYDVDDAGDTVLENAGEGIDTVRTSLAAYALAANVERLFYTGFADFAGTGNALDNSITGGAGNDMLAGGAGNDTLDGGSGRDVMIGGTGDDTYIVSAPYDTVFENAGEGNDTVQTSLATFALGDNVENLTFTGTGAFSGIGNALDNRIAGGAANDTLVGGDGNDRLDGGAGDDTLSGGTGDDTYLVDTAGDAVFENAGEGNDTVVTSLAAYTLGTNVENLVLVGGQNAAGSGNALANAITGGTGNDTLDGGAGADVLAGGLGDDTYVVDDAGDQVIEAAGAGTDTVRTSLTAYTLSANVENLTYVAAVTAGSGGAAAGLAFMGKMSKRTRARLAAATARSAALAAAVGFTGTGNALDNRITGGDGNDTLSGGDGNDTLDGGAGDDVLVGGTGNDTYIVRSAGDQVIENANEGTDTVVTTLGAYTLTSVLENLSYIGTGPFAGTGNDAANQITGGVGDDQLYGLGGNDVLDGGTGTDMLVGGLGDDTYVLRSALDTVVEYAGEGTDTILTTVASYALGDNIENLAFIGTGGFAGTGNALDNQITGGAGNDRLDGGAGNDTLTGGLGDDTYVVDAAGDAVIEAAGGGTDTVATSLATYTLGANVENLVLTGAGGVTGTGNALANAITGGAGNDTLSGLDGNDVLDGGAGSDTLIGGTGDDGYRVDSAADAIVENAGEGCDTVLATASAYTLSANVEALSFVGTGSFAGTGNDAANALTGGAGDDQLSGLGGDDRIDGGAGADRMAGGTGDDTYVVDSTGDVVTENAAEGTDTVLAGIASYTLGANLENLSYTGTAGFSGTGNALDNVLTGGAGNDTLSGLDGNDRIDGGAGADRMAGGTGDDTYIVDATGDAVTENANEGTDTVLTSLAAYTLGANVEKLVYTGTAAFAGTGNALANTITGGAGADTLTGGAGADVLIGGDGSDTASYAASALGVTVDLTAGTGSGGDAQGDTLFGIENVTGSNYADTLTGTTGANTLNGGRGNDTLYGLDGNDVLNGQSGADAMFGGTGDDFYTVDDAGDRVTENAGEGYDTVQSSIASYTLGANVEKLTYGGTTAFTGTGNELDNAMVGNSGNDTLSGLAGNDAIDGGLGNDVLDGGIGDDTLEGRAGADRLIGGDGNDTATYLYSTVGVTASLATGTGTGGDAQGDTLSGIENLTGSRYADTLIGDANANVLNGGAGNDTLNGAGGTDVLIGGIGDDTYYVDNFGVLVVDGVNQGTDRVITTLGSYSLDANVEDLTFAGTGAFIGVGNAIANVIRGGSGSDWLDGGQNGDTLIGGNGDDTYIVDSAQDVVSEQANGGTDTVRTTRQSYTLGGNVENLVYAGTYPSGYSFAGTGNALANILTGGSGTDYLDGQGGDDTLIGGLGDDIYTIDTTGDRIVENAGEGTDTVRTSLLTYTLADVLENLTLTASGATGTGNAADNILSGAGGNDTLYGLDGNDFISGGLGADTMVGGIGDDTYRVDNAYDVVVENAGEGYDTVRTMLAAYALGANVEALAFNGIGDFAGTGNTLDNAMTGGSGNDTLDGGAGNDTLTGGLGNDTYLVDAAGDAVVENANEGTDTVLAAADAYALGANVETLVFTGTGGFAGTGNALDNAITGGSGNDTLDGGAGNDTLTGGTGDDTYLVDAAGDVTVENAGEGYDTVRATAAAYALGANVEALAFAGTGGFAGTGNALDNAIAGGTGNDTLDGGAGNDTLTGGLGDDTYLVDSAGDVVVENPGEGTDTIRTTLTAYAIGENVENLAFAGTGDFAGTGNALTNTLTGGTGNDTLDGGQGDDVLVGGLGNDTYLVDGAGDAVFENAGEGIDTVRAATAAYTLGANVEALTFTGTGDFAGTGNALANTLTGGTGNDTLDGGQGDDVLAGGTGNDTYLVDSAGDAVFENGGEGNDTVRAATGAYTLGANVENLVFAGTGDFAGTGNGLDNAITGGTGNDTLDGGTGNDTLTGGLGDDTYLIDSIGDAAVENPGEGFDTIRTTLSAYTLGQNVEALGFSGFGDFAGTGNAADNRITGGSGNDTLDGGAGNDTLAGGLGNDLYLIDSAGDTIVENPGEGFDTVRTTLLAYTLAAGVEALAYSGTAAFAGTGNAADNQITGGAGNDTLDGAAGNDTLTGGTGNDTYVVDSTGDTVVENAGEGTDTVRTTLAAYTLAANVENLAFAGTGGFAGTGNALANQIAGGSGNDVLDGGAGNDVLTGGSGDDTYLIDSSGDAIVEAANGGIDTVRTTLNAYTLGATLENLGFVGVGDFVGTGNALDNAITGGAGNDRLSGLAGNDTLSGGAGADQLNGGIGLDTLSGGDDNDTLTGESQLDTISGDGGNDVIIGDFAVVGGSTGSSNDKLYGGAGDDTIYGDGTTISGTGGGKDIIDGGDGNDTLYGDAQSSSGTVAFGDDTLTGGAGDDLIWGDAASIGAGGSGGSDRIDGGTGNDRLYGGTGNDTFLFSANGFGRDVIGDFGQVSGNRDVIDLTGLKTKFSALSIVYSGGNAIVTTTAQDSITLIGVSSLTTADFRF